MAATVKVGYMDHDTRLRLGVLEPPRSNLYGPANVRTYGAVTHADKFGTDICLRSAAPPPVKEYDNFLGGGNRRHENRVNGIPKTGFRLRRIVIMRRAGSTWKECAEAVGVNVSTAKQWTEFLPRELAV